MKDFFSFRRMLTPIIIQILFWLGVASCLVTGIVDILHKELVYGLQIFFLGPILVRMTAEVIILFFRMNETMTDIKNNMREQKNN